MRLCERKRLDALTGPNRVTARRTSRDDQDPVMETELPVFLPTTLPPEVLQLIDLSIAVLVGKDTPFIIKQ